MLIYLLKYLYVVLWAKYNLPTYHNNYAAPFQPSLFLSFSTSFYSLFDLLFYYTGFLDSEYKAHSWNSPIEVKKPKNEKNICR